MKLQHIIGVDLSKESIDLAFHQPQSHFKIDNSISGFREMIKWLKQQKVNCSDVVIVMEHTGLYSYQLENFLNQHQISFVKVSALAIKKSLGLIRGKNDKIDAQRIARYGYEKRDLLVCADKPNETLERLRMLHSTRRCLIKHRASLKCVVKEYRNVIKQSDLIIQSHLVLIKNFNQQIKKIDAEISTLIKEDPVVSKNFQLLNTVKSVGKVTAIAAIVKTQNFTKFTNARKFACYSGTAPFQHSSGKSIRGKTRVSHLADKEMKTLLHQSAKTAVQHDEEIRAFYHRRIAMGKSKKSTLNIVRNKIVYRMFAVIKRQTPFVENYSRVA